jgi:hypothetical protein
MKKIIYVIGLISVLSGTGCTDDFERLNTNPAGLETSPSYLPYIFTRAQIYTAWVEWQVTQNLYADLYAQYYALTTTSFNSDRYVMHMNWLPSQWKEVYIEAGGQLQSILSTADPDSPEHALASILWVWMFHRLTDGFGPIPYFGACEKDVVPYTPMDQIYDDFFKRLEKADANLKSHPGDAPFKGYDIMYDGDAGKWSRFANTLRLRLALRVSKIDPARAKQEAEAAVAAGVFTDNADCASVAKSSLTTATFYNFMSQTASYNEFAMSSTIASYLKGYNDPRMRYFFQPAVATGTYQGLRNGLPVIKQAEERNTAGYNSNIGTYWVTYSTTTGTFTPLTGQRAHVTNASEANFLRAEGALNGWNMGGNAKDFYEAGIRLSLSQWEATETEINDYLANNAVPVAPDDSENSPAVSTTPTRWSNDPAMQRKQVGTQKWLAVWPDGHEAWAEFRRTGYPDLYQVVQNDNADIPQGQFIKRLPYPDTEALSNPDELAKGRQLLGGPDNCATRLWWDVD